MLLAGNSPVAAQARRATRYRRGSRTCADRDVRTLRAANIDDLWQRDCRTSIARRAARFGWSHGKPRVSTSRRLSAHFAVVKPPSLDRTPKCGSVRRKRFGWAHFCAHMSDQLSFAERLVKARIAAGMTKQIQLLDVLDSTAQTSLSAWETGKREPSVDDIRKLAIACKCSADYLLGLSDVIEGAMAGQWIVDDDRVDMIRAKKVPPDRGRFAHPIPLRFHVRSSTQLQELEDDLFGKKRK